MLAGALGDADVVLLDGHHPRIAAAVLHAAPAGLPTVLDAAGASDSVMVRIE